MEPQAVHLAAVLLRHAAVGRQGAVVTVSTICLEAKLAGGALRHDQLKVSALLQDGSIVAAQVLTQQRGDEDAEEERSSMQELQRVQPA